MPAQVPLCRRNYDGNLWKQRKAVIIEVKSPYLSVSIVPNDFSGWCFDVKVQCAVVRGPLCLYSGFWSSEPHHDASTEARNRQNKDSSQFVFVFKHDIFLSSFKQARRDSSAPLFICPCSHCLHLITLELVVMATTSADIPTTHWGAFFFSRHHIRLVNYFSLS